MFCVRTLVTLYPGILIEVIKICVRMSKQMVNIYER